MAKKAAWNSSKSDVYHKNMQCMSGNNIEDENYRDGDGGKGLCDECKRLNRARK